MVKPILDDLPVERVLLFADYSAGSPLFIDGVLVPREDMARLGLDDAIANRLVDWQRLFDENYSADCGAWTDRDARDDWYAESELLIVEVRRQLALVEVELDVHLWQSRQLVNDA